MPLKPPTPKQLRRAARERFLLARKAESGFQRQLSSVSNQVGALVSGFAPGGKITDLPGLRAALQRYAEIIRPWARAVTANMHAQVSRRDLKSWIDLGRTMGRELRREIASAPTGEAMRQAMALQVSLITSLPTEAAERVHELAREAIIQGTRIEEIQQRIMQTGHVTLGRARTIARTEVARTASLLTESRARYVGSTHYEWVSSHDQNVRPLHRKLDGHIFAWDDPPIADESGIRAHPGQIFNCRCWASPLIPD